MMTMRRPFGVVYGLYDSSGLRYVGQTVRTPERRLAAHMSRKSADHRGRWIASLVDSGQLPRIKILAEADNRSSLDSAEISEMAKALASGADLVNTLPGGGVNRTGIKHTAETRSKMRAARLGKRWPASAAAKMREYARARPEEHTAKIALGVERAWAEGKFKAHKHRPETRELLRELAVGRRPTAVTRKRMSEAAKARVRSPCSEATKLAISAANKATARRKAFEALEVALQDLDARTYKSTDPQPRGDRSSVPKRYRRLGFSVLVY